MVIPVYQEVAALRETVAELLPHLEPLEAELILVDDGSSDGSEQLVDALAAEHPRVRAVHHERNAGYGQALKTGADYATHPFLVFFDADGQHDPATIPLLLACQAQGDLDMVIGRRLGQARATPWRAPAKWVLVRVAEVLTRARIADLNSGLRLIRKDTFRRVEPLLPSGFSLSTTLTVSGLKLGLPTGLVDTRVRARTGTSTVRPLRDGYRTVLLIVRLVVLFEPLTVFTPLAALAFGVATTYGVVWAALVGRGFPTAAVYVGLAGLLVFLLGIVCDQVSALRMDYLGLRPRHTASREGPSAPPSA